MGYLRLALLVQYSEAKLYPLGYMGGARVVLEVDLDALAAAHARGATVIDMQAGLPLTQRAPAGAAA